MFYETIREAAEAWVTGFNAIPTKVIEKLMSKEEINELTPPCVSDRVYIFGNEWKKGEYGEITGIEHDDEDDLYLVRLDDTGKEVVVSSTDFEVERDSYLPMWGTMWSFGEPIDEEWANGKYLGSNLQEMADCGLRIYEQEDYGLIFGIDGCGYDFYEQHWIPLYKARGLRWHKEDEHVPASVSN